MVFIFSRKLILFIEQMCEEEPAAVGDWKALSPRIETELQNESYLRNGIKLENVTTPSIEEFHATFSNFYIY